MVYHVLFMDGVRPTEKAKREVISLARSIKKNQDIDVRFFVYEGDVLRASQSTLSGAKKYMSKGRTLLKIYGD